MLGTTLGIISASFLFILFYYKVIKPSKYWEEKDVVHAKSLPLVGSFKHFYVGKKHLMDVVIDIYKQFPHERCVGFMQSNKPILMIRDLDLIKRISKKDSDYFENIKTSGLYNYQKMRLNFQLFFTESKLEFFYDLISRKTQNFLKEFEQSKWIEIEAKNKFSALINNILIETVFGLSLSSDLHEKLAKNNVTENLEVFELLIDNCIRNQKLKNSKNNFLNFMLETQSDENIKNDIFAQCLLFLIYGFNTIPISCSFMAYELSINPDVQKKLHLEIDKILEENDGKIPFKLIKRMEFLDQVVFETLRLWPPEFQISKSCTKNYVIEPKNPKEKVVFVEKDISVIIPTIAIHRDVKYFQNPNKFIPDRFKHDKKFEHYFPFGLGFQNCIGSEFALLQIKTLFVYLLAKFIIVPIEKTEIPLKFSSKNVTLVPDNGFPLALKTRIRDKV